MIVGYAHNGHCYDMLRLYVHMQWASLHLDHVTFSSVLNACVGLEALQQGKDIHAYVIRNAYEVYNPIGNSLFTMYIRYRSLENA